MLDFECIEQWVLENQQQLFTLASQLFDHPETAQQERFACSTLCNYLEEHGFRIEKGVGELETAFVARWGERGPSIGLLAEYDALPNSYQPVQARQYPASDRPGHACGHHLIGAASVVAAAAVRTLAQRLNISPHQLSYVTNSGEGEGLLFYGNVILPFVDHFPKDIELYRIMTTKLSEVSKEKEG